MTEVWFTKQRYHESRDMQQWCQDNFGAGCWGSLDGPERYGVPRSGNERWGYDSAFGNFCFYFRDGADATLFSLRWTR